MTPITIEKSKYGFTVKQGERYAEHLTFDEVLGLISTLIHKELDHIQHENWMKTKKEWEIWNKRFEEE